MLLVKDQVDGITSQLMSFEGEEYTKKVEGPVSDFLSTLADVVTTFRHALLFMLMKVSFEW